MSRIRIFTLLATVVVLAGALSACGGGGGGEDPKAVIEEATLEGVESGTVDLSIAIASEGEEAGNAEVTLSGKFQSRGPGALPELAFDVSAKGEVDEGESVDFDGSVTLLSDRAFIGYRGTDYEVDPTSFGFVKSGIEQGLAESGADRAAAESSACQKAAAAIDLTTMFDNLESEGGADVDGTATTKVSGDLDPEAAIDAIIALSEDPACATAFEAAGPLPLEQLEAAKSEFSQVLEKAHAEVYVGEDGIIRKAVAELTVAPNDESEKAEISFEFTLGAVNEKQEIAAPADAQPLAGLFEELDVDPMALFEAAGGEGLGGLLEGLGGGSSDGGSGEGGVVPDLEELREELPDAGTTPEYLDCLSEARSAADLQKCSALLE